MWLSGIWEPFFVQFHRTVVAPSDLEKQRNVSILHKQFFPHMNKVYRLNGITIVACVLGVLLALVTVWVFIDACIDPAKADNRLGGVIVMGIIMLFFLALSLFGIIELNDSIILTEEGIKFHLHRQTFARPYSLKAINDEVLWKDIQDASFDRRDNTTFLVLELVSGEKKEFGIGHIEKRVMVDIESRLYPERYINEEEEEDPDRPDSLEWSKKKAFRKLLICAAVEAIGAVLIAAGQRWGVLVSFGALIYGGSSLYQYYTYNSIVSNPVLAKKGRKMILLGALLLVAIIVAVVLISDATIPPAS